MCSLFKQIWFVHNQGIKLHISIYPFPYILTISGFTSSKLTIFNIVKFNFQCFTHFISSSFFFYSNFCSLYICHYILAKLSQCFFIFFLSEASSVLLSVSILSRFPAQLTISKFLPLFHNLSGGKASNVPITLSSATCRILALQLFVLFEYFRSPYPC